MFRTHETSHVISHAPQTIAYCLNVLSNDDFLLQCFDSNDMIGGEDVRFYRVNRTKWKCVFVDLLTIDLISIQEVGPIQVDSGATRIPAQFVELTVDG